jgi:hypothetical protein
MAAIRGTASAANKAAAPLALSLSPLADARGEREGLAAKPREGEGPSAASLLLNPRV